MKPHEIRPDTQLCTILGYNAQRGERRRYFNRILNASHTNATAIALNITDEHFAFTMEGVAHSKVDKMMLEPEFASCAVGYCQRLNPSAQQRGRIDFIEVVSGEIVGYCLDEEALACFGDPAFVDETMLLVAKMMLIANRWFGVALEVDQIPLLIGEENA